MVGWSIARIVSNSLTVLEDDEKFFVEYQGAMTLRQETLDEYPAIAEIMAPIREALTNETITELNGRVDTTTANSPAMLLRSGLRARGCLAKSASPQPAITPHARQEEHK